MLALRPFSFAMLSAYLLHRFHAGPMLRWGGMGYETGLCEMALNLRETEMGTVHHKRPRVGQRDRMWDGNLSLVNSRVLGAAKSAHIAKTHQAKPAGSGRIGSHAQPRCVQHEFLMQ